MVNPDKFKYRELHWGTIVEVYTITIPLNTSVITRPKPNVRDHGNRPSKVNNGQEKCKGQCWSKSKHQASRHTNQVKTQSRSMAEASQNGRPKQLEKWDESKWKKQTKQAKRDKRSRPSPAKWRMKSKTSEVHRWGLLKHLLGKTWAVPKGITKSLSNVICSPSHHGNQQPIWIYVFSRVTNF